MQLFRRDQSQPNSIQRWQPRQLRSCDLTAPTTAREVEERGRAGGREVGTHIAEEQDHRRLLQEKKSAMIRRP